MAIEEIKSALGSAGIGGAVGDLFGAIGDEQAAAAYGKEAQIAGQNEALATTSAAIQEAQQARAVTQAIGSEQATTANAGFTMGGNASDLLRQSIQQGALAKSLITQQGTITALGFEEQRQAALGKEAASRTAGTGGFLSGIFKAATGITSLFSDRRLKENIKLIGKFGKFTWYKYNYIGSEVLCVGVMADEVEAIMPEAVTLDATTGFKKVNYAMLIGE